MGYNSILVVLNDHLHTIENDPEFGKKVAAAIREHPIPEEYRRTYISGAHVVSVQHADCTQVVAVGANKGRVLGYGFWRDDDDALIRSLERERKMKRRVRAQLLGE